MKISTLAEKYAPWTTSKCDEASNCPMSYDLKYLQKRPAEAWHETASVGTAAHSILEFCVLGASFSDACSRALLKHHLTSEERESLSMLYAPIEAFMRRFDAFKTEYQITEVFTEQKWAIGRDGASAPWDGSESAPLHFFRGVVDLAALSADRDLYILDHKSGQVANVRHKAPQLDAYAVLGVENLERVSGVHCGINALSNTPAKQILWGTYRTADQVRRALKPWLFEHVNDAALNLETFAARPRVKGFPCTHCSYRVSCSPLRLLKGITNAS